MLVKISRNKRKRQPIGMLGRNSGNHDWLLANASACVSCGFRLRNARNASDCVWMETGLQYFLCLSANSNQSTNQSISTYSCKNQWQIVTIKTDIKIGFINVWSKLTVIIIVYNIVSLVLHTRKRRDSGEKKLKWKNRWTVQNLWRQSGQCPMGSLVGSSGSMVHEGHLEKVCLVVEEWWMTRMVVMEQVRLDEWNEKRRKENVQDTEWSTKTLRVNTTLTICLLYTSPSPRD